jgi:DNA-binding transcriptional ArsR family regulator
MSQRRERKSVIIKDQLWELKHPIRVRILAMAAKDPGLSFVAADLAADLRDEFDVSVSQVAYHVARLRNAEMLPRRKLS